MDVKVDVKVGRAWGAFDPSARDLNENGFDASPGAGVRLNGPAGDPGQDVPVVGLPR
ncbi:MAG TPA: hypothetical protein VET24_16860 [Actinomycetota bacterium]|nr:hypothetical protein [Actinomycetota bacterium]